MKYQVTNNLDLGLTNQIFLTQEGYLLRYSTSIVDQFLDRNNEIKIIESIQKSKFKHTLPIIDYGFDHDRFYIATRFENELFSLDQIGLSRSLYARILDLIKKFHKINVKNEDIKIFQPKKLIIWFYNHIKVILDRYINPDLIQNILDNTNQVNKEEMVLSHNDLVLGNFVTIYNRLYLIDFEYASLNDPLFDFASFISESIIKENDVNFFLSICNFNEQQIKRINQWIIYQNLLWSLWANYMFENTNNPIYQTIFNNKIKMLKNPFVYKCEKDWL